jgi:hypothetical protein
VAAVSFDDFYGKGAWDALVEALQVPDHPAPQIMSELGGGKPDKVYVWWPNGAHMTVRLTDVAAHFQELCSAVGREAPTGLYSALCERLLPVFQGMGIHAVTCEPATDFAKDKLRRRGQWGASWWSPDVWMWWTLWPADHSEARYVVDQAKALVETVQREREPAPRP